MICAVQGMVAGGAFYWLNEADVIICSDDATFFEPHISYGMTAALEPIRSASKDPARRRLAYGAYSSSHERLSAAPGPAESAWSPRCYPATICGPEHDELAHLIAQQSPVAVQGTVRAIWEALDVGRKAGAGSRDCITPCWGITSRRATRSVSIIPTGRQGDRLAAAMTRRWCTTGGRTGIGTFLVVARWWV